MLISRKPPGEIIYFAEEFNASRKEVVMTCISHVEMLLESTDKGSKDKHRYQQGTCVLHIMQCKASYVGTHSCVVSWRGFGSIKNCWDTEFPR